MKTFRDLAKKWARYVSRDKKSLTTSFILAFFGVINLFIYFFGSLNSPAVLVVGVFLLNTSLLLFERSGFVDLLKDYRNKPESDKFKEKNLVTSHQPSPDKNFRGDLSN